MAVRTAERRSTEDRAKQNADHEFKVLKKNVKGFRYKIRTTSYVWSEVSLLLPELNSPVNAAYGHGGSQ